MIKGAIFDVDGTLLDSMAIWEEAGERYLERLHIKAEPGLSNILFPMSLEEGASYLKETYEISLKEEEIVKGILEVVKDYYFYEAPLKLGTESFLKEMSLKKIPMVIATSSEKSYIEAAFHRLNIDQYFSKIITCSEVGAGKSKPDIYLKAQEFLNFKPEEIYVFEDVLHAIQTAKNAGFKTVGIYDTSSEKDWETIKKTADIFLEDLHDFSSFWKQIS